jgi:hypothetical protein
MSLSPNWIIARCDWGKLSKLTAADSEVCLLIGCVSERWIVGAVHAGWSWVLAVAASAAVGHSISTTVGTLCCERKAARNSKKSNKSVELSESG